jgi:hypothetical protein
LVVYAREGNHDSGGGAGDFWFGYSEAVDAGSNYFYCLVQHFFVGFAYCGEAH